MEKRLGGCDSKLVFAEVTRHRITRQLEDTVWVKFINSTNRKLYALELIELSPEEEEEPIRRESSRRKAKEQSKVDNQKHNLNSD